MTNIPAEIIMQGNNNAFFTTNASVVYPANIQIFHIDGRYKFGDGVTNLATLPFLAGGTTYALTTSEIGGVINGATSAIPNDYDLVMSVDTSVAKKNTWTQIKSFLKTYFDTIYTTTSAVASQISSALTGYATQSWVTSQGYITNVIASLGYAPESVANKDATGGYVGLTLFKINFKNVANTFTSFFTNSNTASRTYTFQDRNGTIADDTDLAGKQATLVSATNIKTVNSNSLLGSGNVSVGTVLGSVGATATFGTPIPYSSGVANTVTSSVFWSIYNIGTVTKQVLANMSTSQQQGYFFEENGQYGGLFRYGSAFTATNFTGTSFPKSNAYGIEASNALLHPIVFLGSPIILGIGTTSTNVATRHDATGWRVGTMADVHTANTSRFEIGAGSAIIPFMKLNSGTVLTTPINGVVEYDATNLKITALGTRQNILKGLSGSFSGTGTATVAFTVTFGNTQPNTTYQVNITPTNALTAAVLYVTSKTTTTFTVTFLTGLTGTVAFDWVLIQ